MADTVRAGACFVTARARLEADGYSAGRPSDGVDADADQAICAQLRCVCGHHGLTYRPFIRTSPAPRRVIGYRILAVCPCCERCQEI